TKEAIKGTPHDLPGMSMGKVRDIDWDRIESQLHTLVKGRPMIGILPQATDKAKQSGFGGAQFDRVALVDNVFTALNGLKGITLAKPTGVVLSGHSGAGATFAAILGKESKRLKEAQPASAKDAPPPMNELVLFDAINGPGELRETINWVRDQHDDDLKQLGSDVGTKLRENYHLEELAKTEHEASMGGEGKDRFVEALEGLKRVAGDESSKTIVMIGWTFDDGPSEVTGKMEEVA